MAKRVRQPAAFKQLTNFLGNIPGKITTAIRTPSKKCTFEEAKGNIDEILGTLKRDNSGYFDDKVSDALVKLGEVPRQLTGIGDERIPQQSFALFQEQLLVVADYLSEQKYAQLCVKMTNSLLHSLHGVKRRSFALVCLSLLLDSFRNYTDRSLKLAKDFGESGGVETVLKLLTYINNSMNGFADDDRTEATVVHQRSMAILHNCIRVCPDNRHIYRKANAIEVLSGLRNPDEAQSSDDNSSVFLLLILAYIVDEHESESLAKSQGCVRKITVLLNEAVQREGHYASYHELGTTTAFSALELVDGLNHLAISDANKAEIERHGGLTSILRMLNNDFSEEEQKIATATLWRLTFLDSVKRSHEVQESVDTLQSLAASDNEGLREVSSYALWEIQDNQRNEQLRRPLPSNEETIGTGQAQDRPGGHVMLSYQWDTQERVICIRDRLIQDGFKVWMDINHMRGDILEAMADAVERADVILICITEKYKCSSSCRSEASYASKLKKPIIPLLLEANYEADGWLGLLLGTKLYYTFCNDDDMLTNMDKLITAIGERGRGVGMGMDANVPSTDVIDGPVSTSESPIVTASPAPSNQPTSDATAVTGWSTEQVQTWLHGINLPDLCSSLDFCDGHHLKEMYKQYKQSPDTFRHDMKEDLGLGFRDLLKFTTALGQLFKD